MKRQQAAVHRYLIPSKEQPLLEVCFEAGVSEEEKTLCLAYWEFGEPGTWTWKVAEIGPSGSVLRTVRQSCRAYAVSLLCPQCSGPMLVKSRSDFSHFNVWGPDSSAEEQVSRVPCEACLEVVHQERQKAQKQAAEEQRKHADAKSKNASAWIADHRSRNVPQDNPSVDGALALLTMVEIMERKDCITFGPLSQLDYCLGTSPSADIATLKNLYQQRWIVPTVPAKVDDFAYNDDATVRGVYVARVPWRLAYSLGADTPQVRRDIADEMRRYLRDQGTELEEVRQDLDGATAVLYLDSLLMKKYDEQPVPEHRLQEAYDTFHDALRAGFTLGQLLAVAWSAAAGSVAWGQRTPGLKAGSVSSASVTNLGRRIGWAKDRPVPEYDLPNWVTPPATRATLVRLLEQHQAESVALARFRSLRQRVSSRDIEALELDGDLGEAAEGGEATTKNFTFAEHFAEKSSSDRHSRSSPPVTYALVTPAGSLEFRTESPEDMRNQVGMPGTGLVERIMLTEPRTLHSYVGELGTAARENANRVAAEMLRLLGCYDGPFYGPVSFFAVHPHWKEPRSLDQDQQELLCAAHEVAQGRESASAQ